MTTTTATAQPKTNTNVVRNAYKKPKKWSFEKCLSEAQKHTSISEWANASDSSYRAAKRYDWMSACTKHMTKYPDWDRKKCLEAVSAFSSVADWRSESSESYRFARDTSEAFMKQCKRVIAKNGKRTISRRWTKENVLAEARKYKTVTEWHAKGGGSYRKAKANEGWWNEATAHMVKPEREKKPYIWTEAKCLKTAKRYSRKSDWLKASPSSYQAAERYGWMEDCTSHMKSNSLH